MTVQESTHKSGFLRFIRQLPKRITHYFSLSFLRIVDVGAGLLKDIILTKTFGLGLFLDAYFITINYVDMVSGYFQQMGYGILLPLYNDQHKEADNPEERQHRQEQLIVAFLNYTLLSTGLVAIGIFILHQWLGQWVAPTLAGHPDSHLNALLLVTLPIGMLWQGSYALRLLLIQQQRFILFHLPGILSTLIFIGLVWGLYPSQHEYAVIWAFPLSQVVQFLLYWQFLGIRWSFTWKTPSTRRMLRYSLPNTFICLLYYLFIPVDNYFLAMLPSGELSAFRYGAKIVSLLSTISVFSLQLTLIPRFMEAGSRKDPILIKRLIKKGFLESLVFSIPIILAGYFISPILIKLLFERGAFGGDDTQRVVTAVQILIFQLPYIGCWMLISRGFNSLYFFKPFLIVGAIALLMRVGLDWYGLHFNGLQGIAWMSTLQYYIMLCLGGSVLWSLLKRLPEPTEPSAPSGSR